MNDWIRRYPWGFWMFDDTGEIVDTFDIQTDGRSYWVWRNFRKRLVVNVRPEDLVCQQ